MAIVEHITLIQLQTQINECVEVCFAMPVWVVAELADIKVNRTSGHCYMELIEKGGANGVPSAQVRAMAWRMHWGLIENHFHSATETDLAVGMKVLLLVKVTYHPLYGLSLQVFDIDPAYTLGDMAAQKETVIAQLKSEGVWDMNRETQLPIVVQRIAVVSSAQAAGYQDFVNELNSYEYAFRVELFEALMQGERAEETIIGALERIGERQDEFDAVIVIRGGGSQTDLNFLNSYSLAANVAQFPLPVIAGLGHDKDVSIVDMVAHKSLKTPTAVAQFLAQLSASIDGLLDDFEVSICNRTVQVVTQQQQQIANYMTLLNACARGIMMAAQQRIVNYTTLLNSHTVATIVRYENALTATQTLLAERLARVFATENHRLELVGTAIKSSDPTLILARGFAIVHHNGKAVMSADEVNSGERLDITLSKGRIEAVKK